MPADYASELASAIEAVRIASRVCQSVRATITPDVIDKKDNSPVTVADFASQAVICRALSSAFPNDPIIGEEDSTELRGNALFLARVREELKAVGIAGTDDDICGWIDRGNATEYSDRFWTLDPIDGTKGFLRGGQYAVALALIVGGRIQVAAVGCPNLAVDPHDPDEAGTIFHAVRGKGAREESLQPGGQSTVVRVSNTTDITEARFSESVESGHSAHGIAAEVAESLGITREPLRMDSQAKYAVVARGEADIYLRLPVKLGYKEKIWDHAGGVLVVQEAGGVVTDITGKPLDFTRGTELTENRGVVVSNAPLHRHVLKALAETYRNRGQELAPSL